MSVEIKHTETARVSPDASIEAIPLHAPETPRTEYRRRDVRDGYWMSLNGPWLFKVDNDNKGLSRGYPTRRLPTKTYINAPWPPTHPLSGLFDGSCRRMTHIWEQKEVEIPEEIIRDKILRFNFGSVNFASKIYLNGELVKINRGRTGFSVLPNMQLWNKSGPNLLTVESYNNPSDDDHGHAKESEKLRPDECNGPHEPGIRKSVDLEILSQEHIKQIKLRPDFKTGIIGYDVGTHGDTYNMSLTMRVTFKGGEVAVHRSEIGTNGHARGGIVIPNFEAWYPDPNLYDLEIYLGESDAIRTFTGFSEIEQRGEKLYLNGEEFYARGALWHPSNPNDASEWDQTIDYLKDDLGLNTLSMHMDEEQPVRDMLARKAVVGMQSGWPWGLNMRDPNKWRGEVGRWGRFVQSVNFEPETKLFAPLVETWFVNDEKYPERSIDPGLLVYMHDGTLSNKQWVTY